MAHLGWQRVLLLAISALLGVALIGVTIVSSLRWIDRPFPGFFVHENLTVGPYFLSNWSGAMAGVKSLDRILAVDGRPVARRSDLYDPVRRSPAGAYFYYRVLRDRSVLDIAVPSMRFSFNDWLLSFGVYATMAVAFLIIGITPYLLRAPTPAAFPLALMGLALFVWLESTFDFVTSGLLPKELRILGLTLTPSAAMHLGLSLRIGRPLRQVKPFVLAALYGCALLLAWINSAAFFASPEKWIKAFQIAYVYTALGALGFLFIVVSALRGTTESLERSRLRVILAGGAAGLLLPAFGTVLVSSFHWPIPYNVVVIPGVFFPLSVAYALLKYSLFDLGNTFKTVLSRVTLAALFLALYATVLGLTRSWFGAYAGDPLAPLLVSLLVATLANPLLSWTEKALERYIYRPEYDHATVEKQISSYLRSLADAPSLARGFLQRVREQMGIETVHLVYRLQGADTITAATRPVEQPLEAFAPGVEALSEAHVDAQHPGIYREEVTSHPKFRASREASLEIFAALGAELLMPLIFEQKFRGFVAFGAKRSRDYSAEDLRLLGSLTDQLALSLENGRLYQESLQARERAEAANQRLVETDRLKKQFVANICHELRTPVSNVIGFTEVLLDSEIAGKPRENLQKLLRNACELSELMRNLLDFSRIESGAVPTHYEVVQLKEMLAGLELMTQRLIRERPIAFGVKAEAAIDAIETDAQKLQQILMQLLNNALKFTKEGKIELIIRALNKDGREVVEIAVSDTGIGIKKEDQEKIFEPFRQLDGSSTRQYGGTGLGLGLCKKLAEALGGEILVNSEPGMGSVFSLQLPLRSRRQAA